MNKGEKGGKLFELSVNSIARFEKESLLIWAKANKPRNLVYFFTTILPPSSSTNKVTP